MKSQIPGNHFKFMWKRRLMLLMLILLFCLLASNNLTANVKGSNTPVLLGLYAPDYLGTQSVIDSELRQIDDWAGKRHSIAGFFIDIEDSNPAYNIPVPLEHLRENGYTAFINLKSTRQAVEIARGDIDISVRKVAKAYAEWINKGEGRMAFIAPLQEMNIPVETYSKDRKNFKLSYRRIQKIFKEAGVSPKAVRWVFAPNGWSENNEHRFENYYPGSERVDVVAFSGYNWGYCDNSTWKHWNSPQETFEPYIKRMKAIAKGKPIFIAQTGTTSNTKKGADRTAKDQWFRDSYTHLAQLGVKAIIYFNLNKECDWALYSNRGKSAGYKDAVANPAFGYVSPADLAKSM
jgi:hypothetical protein